MQCTVYWGSTGFLLVPECLRASMEAEATYGPLTVAGRLDTDGLPLALLAEIDDALEDHLFALISPDLALRLNYEPLAMVPLAQGFHWEEPDFWGAAEQIRLVREREGPLVIAFIEKVQAGWRITTGAHRPWPSRGGCICRTRTGAMHFLAGWLVGELARERWPVEQTLRTPPPAPAPMGSHPASEPGVQATR